MQALDEEESQMEGSATRIEELEKIVQEKNLALENIEASRGKAMAKLSTTVSRFNELHHLSESLLSEVKNLESQLQGRDAEISFLRQEVTRCTNDVLALQESNKRKSAEVEELLTWSKNMLALHFGLPDVHLDDQKGSQVHAYSEILEKHIASVLSELNDLRVTVQSRDVLLQSERHKVEELLHKGELLEVSLRDKETQLKMLQEPQHSGQPDNMNPTEMLELEPIVCHNSFLVYLNSTPHFIYLLFLRNFKFLLYNVSQVYLHTFHFDYSQSIISIQFFFNCLNICTHFLVQIILFFVAVDFSRDFMSFEAISYAYLIAWFWNDLRSSEDYLTVYLLA